MCVCGYFCLSYVYIKVVHGMHILSYILVLYKEQENYA